MASNSGSLGRRTQAESERTKRRILDRAEQLFSLKGYGGVSMREIAAASRVRHHTIQHHFGSKLQLYEAVLSRWDGELQDRLGRVVRESTDLPDAVESTVEDLFEFFLSKRTWVRLTTRAATGEHLPDGIRKSQQSWIGFMDSAMHEKRFGTLKYDLGLLLITVEGILSNHVLAQSHYLQLYGKTLDDPEIKTRTKKHLKAVVLALVNAAR